DYRLASPYRAYYTALFPSGAQGSMNIAAFDARPYFTFTPDLGSQVQIVRDPSTDPSTAYVLGYNADSDDGFGNDFVHVFKLHFDDGHDVVGLDEVLGSPPCTSFPCPPFIPPPFPFFLPEGGTSFTNTGTHYVDHNGRLLISSSERWAQFEGDP